MGIVARLEEHELDPVTEQATLLRQAVGDGALVSFVGIARPSSHEGRPIDLLTLEHHPRLTLASLEQIAGDAATRFNISNVHVVHRCGAVRSGEAIVFAGATSPHRRAAFEAADYLMDRLKTEAIFWKRETGPDGAVWIEPTAADYDARKRWE